ncbi:MAG: M48 family metallopeptidase, partial [Candidatus Pacebacteria bacterium]|nr:M48 family metallopeptidase [Candidatus Paceibacterota bacterium]
MKEIIYKANPRSKSIKIRIDSHGNVIVSYPKWTPKFVVKKFVDAQKGWIDSHLEKIKQKLSLSSDENSINIFGKKYQK